MSTFYVPTVPTSSTSTTRDRKQHFLPTTNCMVMAWRSEYFAAFTADYKLYGYGVERRVSCCLYCWLQTVCYGVEKWVFRCLYCWLQTVWLWCGEVSILLPLLLTTNCLLWRGEVSISLPLLLTANCMVMVWRGGYPVAFNDNYKLHGYGVERWVSCLSCRLQTAWLRCGEVSVLLPLLPTTNCGYGVEICEHTHHSLNSTLTT